MGLWDQPRSLKSTVDVSSVVRHQCSWEGHVRLLGQWVHISFAGIQSTMICLRWDMAPVSNLAICSFAHSTSKHFSTYSVQSSLRGVKEVR